MRLALLFAVVATPLAAQDMTEQQQAAFDRVLPLIQTQVEGEAATALAECVVTNAKRGELRRIANAELDLETPDPKMTKAANAILQRPEVATCLTDKLAAN